MESGAPLLTQRYARAMLTWSEVRDLLSVAGATTVDELIEMLEEYLNQAPAR